MSVVSAAVVLGRVLDQDGLAITLEKGGREGGNARSAPFLIVLFPIHPPSLPSSFPPHLRNKRWQPKLVHILAQTNSLKPLPPLQGERGGGDT